MIINLLILIYVRYFWQSSEFLRGCASPMPTAQQPWLVSKVTPLFSVNVRNSCFPVAWIWLLYLYVWSSIFLGPSSQRRWTLVRPFMVMASEIDVKWQKCGSKNSAKVLNHKSLSKCLSVDWHWTSIITSSMACCCYVCRRAALIFSVRKVKQPICDIHLLQRSIYLWYQ